MTQYLLSVHHDGVEDVNEIAPEDMERMYKAVDAFNEDLQASGSWVFAGGLQPIEDSTTVDATGTEVVVTDGPFSESKEFLGGFWVIEAPDLDAALKIAAQGSRACEGPVEVRPFQGE